MADQNIQQATAETGNEPGEGMSVLENAEWVKSKAFKQLYHAKGAMSESAVPTPELTARLASKQAAYDLAVEAWKAAGGVEGKSSGKSGGPKSPRTPSNVKGLGLGERLNVLLTQYVASPEFTPEAKESLIGYLGQREYAQPTEADKKREETLAMLSGLPEAQRTALMANLAAMGVQLDKPAVSVPEWGTLPAPVAPITVPDDETPKPATSSAAAIIAEHAAARQAEEEKEGKAAK